RNYSNDNSEKLFEETKHKEPKRLKEQEKLNDKENEVQNDSLHSKDEDNIESEINNELEIFIENTALSLQRAMKDFSIDVQEVDPSKALIASRFIRFRVRLRPGETLQRILRVRSDIAREIEATNEILIDNERGTNFIYVDVPREETDTVNLL